MLCSPNICQALLFGRMVLTNESQTRYVVIGSAQGEVNDGKSQISVSSDSNTYLSIYKNPVLTTL